MARKQQQPIEHPSSALSDRTIIRAQHDPDNPYFIMRRDAAQDSNLSFESRGVLAYILSKSDNWKVRLGDLRREGGFGKEKAQGLVRELESAGYITRAKVRLANGRFDWIVTVHENPQKRQNVSSTPQPGLPAMVKPATAEPATANPAIYKVQTQESTDKENTDSLSAAVGVRALSSSTTQREPVARARDAKKERALSRYTKKAIRLYVDGMGKKARNPGGLTHTLWLSGDGDDDVANCLEVNSEWQEKASKEGVKRLLVHFPHWVNSDHWEMWERFITARVVSHFNLWESAIDYYIHTGVNPIDIQELVKHYLASLSDELGVGAENVA